MPAVLETATAVTTSTLHSALVVPAMDPGNPAVRQRAAARPTVKQHLAAIRMLFDWLIVGQILAINPAHAVRGPKHVVKRGKTPVLTEARWDLEILPVTFHGLSIQWATAASNVRWMYRLLELRG